MRLSSEQLRQGFWLGDRLVQPALNRIRGPEGEVRLEPKVMAVLVCLAERAGEVVSRTALYDAVWGQTIVSDQALTNCISELRQYLADDRAQPRFIETVPKRGYRLIAPLRVAGETDAGGVGRRAGRRLRTGAAALLVAGALGALAWWWSRFGTDGSAPSVVVLPFENAADEERLDYLSLALPDEITTLLTKSGDLVVRPFEHEASGAPVAVARSRDVGYVVTGHYYLEEGNRLTVAVEAQEIAGERLIWRAHTTVQADDLLAMRQSISERVSGGLLPALGVPTGQGFGPRPAHPEAYLNYLRSLALPRHPAPTVRAIEMLEQAVELDPDFAPAWTELGKRWYAHANYGEGGAQAQRKALAAYRQALELDPAAISAAVELVNLRTESGELELAYREARRLVERFDRSAEAYLALAYVYRFGGMLQASQRQCEIALELDPHNSRLRSCAYSYLYAGNLEPVQELLELEEGSYYFHWGMVLLELRRSDDEAALDAARQVAPDPTRKFMEPCLEGQRGEALDTPAAAFGRYWSKHREPELAYALAPMLEYCGRREEALAFLKRAIDRNFCSYPALDQDPIWYDIREDESFRQLREEAIACHRRFRESIDSAVQ
jgi:DNA-binding winged helix-turn-helix (wHTH) protein/tetratricopeptide (TPR) repeat protein/TolB-like protein